MVRSDGRERDELRRIKIVRNYLPHAEGSVFFEQGATRLVATATVEEKVPPFLKGTGSGWVTAEYGMIPRATLERSSRESSFGRTSGRTKEIQRLIGRALRAVVDLEVLGERQVLLDTDIIQADGGTRCAAITASFIALYDAFQYLFKAETISRLPLKEYLAAVSVGLVRNEPYLDLCYEEDALASVDMNVVMTESGKMVEIQGTAEKHPFSKKELDELLSLAKNGIEELILFQKETLGKNGGKKS